MTGLAASLSNRNARSTPPPTAHSSNIGRSGSRDVSREDPKGKAKARMEPVDNFGRSGASDPPVRPPFSTNLSSPIDPTTPIAPRIRRTGTSTSNSASNTLHVPASPAISTFSGTSSHHGSATGTGSGSATPRSATFNRRAMLKERPMDLKAEVDQLEQNRSKKGKEKDKDKDKERGLEGALGLGRKKSTMMLGGIGKGLGRMGSVMRRKDSSPGDAASRGGGNNQTSSSSNASKRTGSSSLKSDVHAVHSSPGSLSGSTRHLMGSGHASGSVNGHSSIRSASVSMQGSLRGKGAPSERMGSVKEEDDASLLSFSQRIRHARTPSALSHTSGQGQVQTPARGHGHTPSRSFDSSRTRSRNGNRAMAKAEVEGRDDHTDEEGDVGITRPFATQHDLHVSPDLEDLPPAWLEALKKQGMTEQDLLLIAAARKKQAAASRRTHAEHGSFSGSISQISRRQENDSKHARSHSNGSPSLRTSSSRPAIKASDSLPRISVSDSYKSTATGRETGSESHTSVSGSGASTSPRHEKAASGSRRSWLGRKKSRGSILSPITSLRSDGGSVSSGPETASTSRSLATAISPTWQLSMSAHQQQQREGTASRESREQAAAKKRLSDQLRGFASLELDHDAGWAEGVLGLMQSGAGAGIDADVGGKGEVGNDVEGTAGMEQGVRSRDQSKEPGLEEGAETAPPFRVQVDQVNPPLVTDVNGLSDTSHTYASTFAGAPSLQQSSTESTLASYLDHPRTPKTSASHSLSSSAEVDPTLPTRSPGRSAVTPSKTHHQLSSSPDVPRLHMPPDINSPPLPMAPLTGRSASTITRVDSPPMRIASPSLLPDRSRTSTPDHLSTRLRSPTSTDLLTKYGPSPHAPPLSALPSPPRLSPSPSQLQPRSTGEIKYSPRPPLRQASKAKGSPNASQGDGHGASLSERKGSGGLFKRGIGSMATGQTRVKPKLTARSDLSLSRRSSRGSPRRDGPGHRNNASMDTAASAEVITPSATDEGRTPRPEEQAIWAPARREESRLEHEAAITTTLSDSDTPSDLERRYGNLGTGLGLGFDIGANLSRGDASPDRLHMRSRRNTQSSMPASAADTDELYEDDDMPIVSGSNRADGERYSRFAHPPSHNAGEDAASPRMSLKTYMFEPDSDDADADVYSAFHEGEGVSDIPPGLLRGYAHGSPTGPLPKSPGMDVDDGTFRLSLYYRTPPHEVPQTPPDAPGSHSPVRAKDKRISVGKVARPLSFSAPYDSMRRAAANGKVEAQEQAREAAKANGSDSLSPLTTAQGSSDRSRRSSRASRNSRVSRRSRSSVVGPSSAGREREGAVDDDAAASLGHCTLQAPGGGGGGGGSSPRKDRHKRISAWSAFSTRSGFSSDSELHDLDLDDLDGTGSAAIVQQARMTHVGAAAGRASIFAWGGRHEEYETAAARSGRSEP